MQLVNETNTAVCREGYHRSELRFDATQNPYVTSGRCCESHEQILSARLHRR